MNLPSNVMPLQLDIPITTQVELEFTNVCNGKCTACPRNDLPKAGMMSKETLEMIIQFYIEENNKHKMGLPEFIIAGGGEPLINKKAYEYIEILVKSGLNVSITTNATRITEVLAEKLAVVGLQNIYISFWGIYQEEYELSMKLPFTETLAKVEMMAKAVQHSHSKTKVLVKWLKTPEIKSTNEEIENFWKNKNIDFVKGYHDEWNRGGLNDITYKKVEGRLHLPDPSRKIWCTDMFFTDTYTWSGECILCCCNYFTSQQIKLGSIHANIDDIKNKKIFYMNKRPLLKMCQECKLPRDNRAKWLARNFLSNLSAEDRKMLVEY